MSSKTSANFPNKGSHGTHRYRKPHRELGMGFEAAVLSKTEEWLRRTGTNVWRTVGREWLTAVVTQLAGRDP